MMSSGDNNLPDLDTVSNIPTQRTMKAAVLESPEHFTIQEVPVRLPEPDEVLIRVEGCGVCGSNLTVWKGMPWFSYPLQPGSPGHEGWGRIVKIGSNVNQTFKGKRAAFISNNAFAQFETVPANAVIVLPDRLAQKPFPGEPLGCAMNILDRCDIRRDQHVAIIGAGFIGTLLTSLVSGAGAVVTVFSRRHYSLEIVQQYGATNVFHIINDNKTHVECALTSRYDCVIEATGYQQSLDLAGKLIKTRGRLVIAGYHQDGLRTIDMQSWNWLGIDVINAHERDLQNYVKGINAAITAHVNGNLPFENILTHTFSLEHINDAFQLLCTRPQGFMKALVMI
jgi:2-desacetyl-2-hydroxyethyl bacteriochlorophyllide A dehydrogenase